MMAESQTSWPLLFSRTGTRPKGFFLKNHSGLFFRLMLMISCLKGTTKRVKHFLYFWINPLRSYHPLSYQTPSLGANSALIPSSCPLSSSQMHQQDLSARPPNHILTLLTSHLYHCYLVQNIICHLDPYNIPPVASLLPLWPHYNPFSIHSQVELWEKTIRSDHPPASS